MANSILLKLSVQITGEARVVPNISIFCTPQTVYQRCSVLFWGCRRNLRAGFGFGESAFKHEGEQFRAVTIKTRSPCVIFVLSREDYFAITEVCARVPALIVHFVFLSFFLPKVHLQRIGSLWALPCTKIWSLCLISVSRNTPILKAPVEK